MLFLVVLLAACADHSNKPRTNESSRKCSLDKDHSPTVRGLKLGMTRDEVGAKWPHRDGNALFPLNLQQGESNAEATLKFYNEKLYYFDVTYLDSINWGFSRKDLPFGGEFQEKTARTLGLEGHGHLILDEGRTRWNCNGFDITIRGRTGGPGGLNRPSITIEDLELSRKRIEDEYKEGRKKVEQFDP